MNFAGGFRVYYKLEYIDGNEDTHFVVNFVTLPAE